jgi:hypothetical protein
MSALNLTAQVLDKFVQTAKSSEPVDQPVVDAITSGIRANPALSRQQILALASRAIEEANGSTP